MFYKDWALHRLISQFVDCWVRYPSIHDQVASKFQQSLHTVSESSFANRGRMQANLQPFSRDCFKVLPIWSVGCLLSGVSLRSFHYALWHINPCGLFNVKSCFLYEVWLKILLVTSDLYELLKLICLHTVK